MKIRTLDNLLSETSSDRIWRVRELAILKASCLENAGSFASRRVARRSFVPIAYAHWEGYVKKTGQAYLDYVATQRLSLKELAPCFQSLYFSIEFNKEAVQSKRHVFQKIIQKLSENSDDRIHIKTKGVISTQGNLNSEVLFDICSNIGIDYTQFSDNFSFIDKILIGKRNGIAHGENYELDISEINEISTKVVGCIDLFRNLVENAATERRFLTP